MLLYLGRQSDRRRKFTRGADGICPTLMWNGSTDKRQEGKEVVMVILISCNLPANYRDSIAWVCLYSISIVMGRVLYLIKEIYFNI